MVAGPLVRDDTGRGSAGSPAQSEMSTTSATITRFRVWLRAAVIALLVSLLYLVTTVFGLGAHVERLASDLLWPVGEIDPRIVVVGIDRDSQDLVGDWPWDAATQADLVERIVAAEPAAMGYDVVLAAAPDDATEVDRLADAFGAVRSAVSIGFASIVRSDGELAHGSEPLAPDPQILQASTAAHSVIASDPDGVTRTLPVAMYTPRGQLLPSVSLALAADPAPGEEPVAHGDSISYGGLTVPVDASGVVRISWADGLASTSPAVVSAADVLDGDVDPERLRGQYVLVGLVDGTVGDMRLTPLRYEPSTPGVIVQAQALNTLLTQGWVTPAPIWLHALVVFVAGTLAAFAVMRLRPWLTVISILGLIGLWIAVALAALPGSGVQADLVRVPGGILAAALVAAAFVFFRWRRERAATLRVLSRYVPESEAARLIGERDTHPLDQGIRRHIAVLFCDLRGSGPILGDLEPQQLRRVLDAYYDHVSERIFAASGALLQFTGDRVFAAFGAPITLHDPAGAARAAASAIMGERDLLNAALAAEGLPALAYGIGVHTGDAVAGAVGTSGRRQYSVVGEVVEVGRRLVAEAAAGEIIVSVAACEPGADGGEPLQVPGRPFPVPVRRILA